jgi:N-acylneuraminate cytidylyltransferase
MAERNVAIIPARGGSKRIPGKNIKTFLGKPIMAYSIECAKEAGIFKEVMVSTDDQEIADVAIKYGASVPFMRSDKNADDFATTADVVREVMDEYNKLGRSFDNICCIYPTAPFMVSDRLKEGLRLLEQ